MATILAINFTTLLHSRYQAILFTTLFFYAVTVQAKPKHSANIYAQAFLWIGTYYFDQHHISDTEKSFKGPFPSQKFDLRIRESLKSTKLFAAHLTSAKAHDLLSTVCLVGLTTPFLIYHESMNFDKWLGLSYSLAMTEFLTAMMKYTVRRQRPYRRDQTETLNDRWSIASFPSGHASTAFVLAKTATQLLPELSRSSHMGLYAIATAVGVMRLGANQHYFTDVLVGSIFGYLTPYLTLKKKGGLEVQLNHNNLAMVLQF